MKDYKKTLIISSLICLLPLVISFAVYNKLPDQIAIHWDDAGNPDNYAAKWVAAFGMPLLLLAIHLIGMVTILHDPKKSNQSAAMRLLSFWLVPVLSVIVVPVTLLIGMGRDIPISTVVTMIVGIVFVVSGNYLPKSRQNYTIGIKLPWTLADVDNWNKTHRLAGALWIAAGIFVLVRPFLPIRTGLWFFFVLAVMVCLPALYSFILYVKKGNR